MSDNNYFKKYLKYKIKYLKLKEKLKGGSQKLKWQDKITSELNRKLLEDGLQPVFVGDDGNCFFRAISYVLYGTEEKHVELRQKLARSIRDSPLVIEGIPIASDSDISRDGAWVSDELEIRRMSKIIKRPIHVYKNYPTGGSIVDEFLPLLEKEKKKFIYEPVPIIHLSTRDRIGIHYISTKPR